MTGLATRDNPDPRWGETPCAFATRKPGGAATAGEVIVWCRNNLAHFEVPNTIVFGPLPKTSTGKIQRFVLRDKTQEL